MILMMSQPEAKEFHRPETSIITKNLLSVDTGFAPQLVFFDTYCKELQHLEQECYNNFHQNKFHNGAWCITNLILCEYGAKNSTKAGQS